MGQLINRVDPVPAPTNHIPTEEFVAAFEEHWTAPEEPDGLGGLANVGSTALRQTWWQLGTAYTDQIVTFNDPEQQGVWPILSPPTGTGKTESIIIYCAMLSRLAPENHPGALIVTRRQADADLIAERVVGFAKKRYNPAVPEDYARSWHSKNKQGVRLDSLTDTPVLVICHRALEQGLAHLRRTGSMDEIHEALHGYREGRRKLLVIDEALDQINQTEVTQQDIEQVITIIPKRIRFQFPVEIAWLKETLKRGEGSKGSIVYPAPITTKKKPNLKALMKAVKCVKLGHSKSRRGSAMDTELHALVNSVLSSMHAFISGWSWYKPSTDPMKNDTVLITAHALIPDTARGAIVLDATSKPNYMYRLFRKAAPLPVIPGTRTYRNVTLHYSIGHQVGKTHMIKPRIAKKRSRELMADLKGRLGEQEFLVVTHQGTEKAVTRAKWQGAQLATAHWGAVEGANVWRDCKTVAVFGLFYRPEGWAEGVYAGLAGIEEGERVLTGTDISHGDRKNVIEALEHGQLVVDVTQAVSRGCCRKVSSEEGDCPAMDIFIQLPDDQTGEAVLAGLIEMLPGVRTKEWDYTGELKKRPAHPSKDEDLAQHLLTLAPEQIITTTELREAVKVSVSALERFVRRYKEATAEDELVEPLRRAGIYYNLERKGSTTVACFWKAE
jgi:hypothetical protein